MSDSTGPDALLVLEDGTTLRGTGFGAEGETFGEMVFNTGMTGYQETLTDPSYCGQIVAMTAPHIGNTGVNDTDPESRRIWVSGYVVREPARIASSWRAQRDLDAELRAQEIPGIAIRGTRALTMRVREHGAMRAAVSTVEEDPARLLDRVLASPRMIGADLARVVTTPEPYTVSPPPGTPVRFRVAAVDLGIKASTPRYMAARGCEVRVLPATVTAAEIMDTAPHGVFFSNGPGDPAAAGYAVAAMRGVLDTGVPVFGICLGSQILSLALGLRTYKLRYGHRGVNQPVMDLTTGRVYITSHNHGFAAALPGEREGVLGASHTDGAGGTSAVWAHVPPEAREPFGTPYGAAVITHVNLNDGVVEGLRLLDRPAFSVQYHPEAAPGTHDAVDLFDNFCALMERAR
ncbi:MAG: glutamine-hydrolyzing carbamoyl-phosphate synthase small subunit [Streptosporangiaceae bacterium]|nr:glutamine-hydrolyzing carbamoyl-phosphate synthase small subunit [Streptosporangiaceae bacterium]MBV9857860.1 glutamine-hydrolyzing carbamoyl-phosphate synthase small subunit [Streptosporangiaceae bacterium]